MSQRLQPDVIVVGSGLAGMLVSLQLAPRKVLLMTRSTLGMQTSSRLAQGGIAAAWSADDDVQSHIDDTLAAGGELCDKQAVRDILSHSAQAIETLRTYGVHFDSDNKGEPYLGLEAAHSHRRIFHVDGDATGRAIVDVLSQKVRQTPSITVLEHAIVDRLLVKDIKVCGVNFSKHDQSHNIAAHDVVLATGGIGGLYGDSTNPSENYGQGLALAAAVGARFADLEFIQFHPTALDTASRPRTLISEAVRGEGAFLINSQSERFLSQTIGEDLAPRDIVARKIAQEIENGKHVFLDARQLKDKAFAERFPSIDKACRQAGIDPQRQPIPVCPAQHYHMGGIATDTFGRTSIAGLWAIGETSSTGLHGANRLASNSLLEACIMAMRTAETINNQIPSNCLADATLGLPEAPRQYALQSVQPIMQRHLGIIRNGSGLMDAICKLMELYKKAEFPDNPAIIALMIAVCAYNRQESRGAHCRSDFPTQAPEAKRTFTDWSQTLQQAEMLYHSVVK